MFAHASDFFNLYIQAGSFNASAALLTELSRHPNSRIRLRVAENPRTSPEILAALACDPDPDVRIAVGVNRATPLEALAVLVKDPDPSVRLGMAQDIGTPAQILDRLKTDEHPYVKHEAEKTSGLLEAGNSLERIDAFSMRKSRRKRKMAQNRRQA